MMTGGDGDRALQRAAEPIHHRGARAAGVNDQFASGRGAVGVLRDAFFKDVDLVGDDQMDILIAGSERDAFEAPESELRFE